MPSFKTAGKLYLHILLLLLILNPLQALPIRVSKQNAIFTQRTAHSTPDDSSMNASSDTTANHNNDSNNEKPDKVFIYNFETEPIPDLDIRIRDNISKRHLKTCTEDYDTWGPHSPVFPEVVVPHGEDPVLWKRQRIIEVAKRYIGLPYQHHHMPLWISSEEGQGVDCSNYSSWVYNFALGIKFTSDIQKQAESEESIGRKLSPDEKLEMGDLLFILKGDWSHISHVVIFIEDGKIIDSHIDKHGDGIQIRDFEGWYKTHHAFTRRIIE